MSDKLDELMEWCEWSRTHHFKDSDIESVFNVFTKQLKNYYTACSQQQDTLCEPVEIDIDNFLIPKLEQLVIADIRLGGKHEMHNRWHQNANLFIMDGRAYCGYKAARGQLCREIKCPLARPCDFTQETTKLLNMIEDLNKISVREFVEKYDVQPPVNGFEELVNNILTNVSVDNITSVRFHKRPKTENEMGGFFVLKFDDDEALLALYAFVSANPEYFGYDNLSLVDGKMNYREENGNIFIPDSVVFQFVMSKDINEPTADYDVKSLLFIGECELYGGIIETLNEKNVKDFQDILNDLTCFFNETVCPMYSEKEQKAFEIVKAKRAAKANIEG